MISKELLAFPEIPKPVVSGEEFPIAAVGLAHGHIYGMCAGLIAAGAQLRYVYDEDPVLVAAFLKQYPNVQVARCLEKILDDMEIRLVASADIHSRRCPLGIRVMESGKDYFADKAPLITLEQLSAAREAVRRTGQKYAVYYGERLGNEASVFADLLIRRGAIGQVINTVGLGPHKLGSADKRGSWFYRRETQGGILIDIGSHQIDQFLYYTGNTHATICSSRIANYSHKEYPEFDDFGDCSILGGNGATGYIRVDWHTPGGVKPFGDGRTMICGTKGYIELRKYTDIAVDDRQNTVILVTDDGAEKLSVTGKVGLPYFGQLILDCLNRTETAMSQEHAFYTAELAIRAQNVAIDCER